MKCLETDRCNAKMIYKKAEGKKADWVTFFSVYLV